MSATSSVTSTPPVTAQPPIDAEGVTAQEQPRRAQPAIDTVSTAGGTAEAVEAADHARGPVAVRSGAATIDGRPEGLAWLAGDSKVAPNRRTLEALIALRAAQPCPQTKVDALRAARARLAELRAPTDKAVETLRTLGRSGYFEVRHVGEYIRSVTVGRCFERVFEGKGPRLRDRLFNPAKVKADRVNDAAFLEAWSQLHSTKPATHNCLGRAIEALFDAEYTAMPASWYEADRENRAALASLRTSELGLVQITAYGKWLREWTKAGGPLSDAPYPEAEHARLDELTALVAGAQRDVPNARLDTCAYYVASDRTQDEAIAAFHHAIATYGANPQAHLLAELESQASAQDILHAFKAVQEGLQPSEDNALAAALLLVADRGAIPWATYKEIRSSVGVQSNKQAAFLALLAAQTSHDASALIEMNRQLSNPSSPNSIATPILAHAAIAAGRRATDVRRDVEIATRHLGSRVQALLAVAIATATRTALAHVAHMMKERLSPTSDPYASACVVAKALGASNLPYIAAGVFAGRS